MQALESVALSANVVYDSAEVASFGIAARLTSDEAAKLVATRATLHHTAWLVCAKLSDLRARVEAAPSLDTAVELAKQVRTLKQALPAPPPLPEPPSTATERGLPQPPPMTTTAVSAVGGAPAIAADDVRDDYAQKSWFFASMNRASAEQALLGRPRGSFVVRPASVVGCLSLTHVDLDSGAVVHGSRYLMELTRISLIIAFVANFRPDQATHGTAALRLGHRRRAAALRLG